MIRKLDNSSKDVAFQIFTVFQSSYKIEAALIGAENFPPLSRSAKNIETSPTQFFGYFEGGTLAGVIEVTTPENCLEIDSLTVSPQFFKRGIAGKLINFVLENHYFSTAIVETATQNLPAIKLYEKHGFIEFKRWTPAHGIEKLAMSLQTTH